MSVYLVRNIDSKGILGLFWAPSLIELWRIIDFTAEPSAYEATPLAYGYLVFDGANEPVPENFQSIPPESLDDDDQFSWAGAKNGDSIWTALHYPEDVKWRRLPHANQPGSPYHKFYNAREAADA